MSANGRRTHNRRGTSNGQLQQYRQDRELSQDGWCGTRSIRRHDHRTDALSVFGRSNRAVAAVHVALQIKEVAEHRHH